MEENRIRMVNTKGEVKYFTPAVANHKITKRNGWIKQELEPIPEHLGGIKEVRSVSLEDIESIDVEKETTTWQIAKDSVGDIETGIPKKPAIKPKQARKRKPAVKKAQPKKD